MKSISCKTLKRLGACNSSIAEFRQLFGDAPVKITRENCIRAASMVEFSWIANMLLYEKHNCEYRNRLTRAWRELITAQEFGEQTKLTRTRQRYFTTKGELFFDLWSKQQHEISHGKQKVM